MELRRSNKADIPSIMHIIHQAQAQFKDAGIDQWQNHYPNESTIRNDIDKGESFLVYHDNSIIGTFVLSFRNEDTYDHIYDGHWLSKDGYAVIHRIAIDNDFKGKGFATQIMMMIEEICLINKIFSIKIDTHEDNKVMRNMLIKNGFEYCGTILLRDGNKRFAYEKLLNL